MSVNVGVIGAGVVGGGVITILRERTDRLAANAGTEVRLTQVCDINAALFEPFDLAGVTKTDDAHAMIADDSVHVICELIGGIEPAKTFTLAALNAGKHVVSANKHLVAYHAQEIAEAAKANGVEYRYEAAVAGGIPIIKSLREGLAPNAIRSVYGILNGTCNYILTQMSETGADFDSVLARAQELGFAETPPDLDIDGHDAAHKCQILASLSYDTPVDIAAIPVEGIREVTRTDVQFADEFGYVIRLLAVIQEDDGELDARVQPTLVPANHLLAHVRNEYNAVYVDGDVTDPTLYYGKGAGRMPTAGAVVADIVDIARNLDAPARAPFNYARELPLKDPRQLTGAYYIRLITKDEPGVLGMTGTILGTHGVSIASCHQRDPHGDAQVNLVMMTHTCQEAALRDAIAEIEKLDAVVEQPHVMRVLEESPA